LVHIIYPADLAQCEALRFPGKEATRRTQAVYEQALARIPHKLEASARLPEGRGPQASVKDVLSREKMSLLPSFCGTMSAGLLETRQHETGQHKH